MLKWYTQPEKKYNNLTYRARDIVLDEKMIEIVLKVPEAIVVSSWRSLVEQKAMVAKGASQTLESNHRRGMAVDIVNWQELDKELEKVGLINDISWDKNHYTPGGERQTAVKYPLINTFEKSETNQYKVNTMAVTKKLDEALKEVGYDFGENLNDKEMDKLGEKIMDLVKERDDLKRLLGEALANPVVKEVPVEVIKEVIKEVEVKVEVPVVKEVKVYESEMSAVELFRLAIKKFIQ